MIKFRFKLFNFEHITCEEIQRILPQNFILEQKDKDIFLTINADDEIDENKAKFLLDRELDRIFFLSGKKIESSLTLVEYPDGRKRTTVTIKYDINAIQKIPEEIAPQQWANNIDVQLKLWVLAHTYNIPLAAKINLLFQIIEIEYPNIRDQSIYPLYNDSTIVPNPMTEAKLLRHIVSHGKSPIKNDQLRKYCDFLELSPEMHDPSNAQFIDVINRRLPIITRLAKEIIEAKLTKI